MLILAGVSINAIVGDNGILTRTQYATFLNEMAAVEEAVGMWKAGEAIDNQGETTAIPTNGMCKSTDITNTERLAGEVGYYRIWSMSETQPVMNILSSANEFNSAFESELIFYPAGVQDLYYLNNEACGIDSKKTYLIDAATGMVYSMTGINLKGVSCYSSNMAKAVMNGDTTAPNFAAAEVSGSGKDEVLAGNTEPEFLPDGTKNPNYNPNGFQIVAHHSNQNVYKLYNNGDLYGKGVKGLLLGSSQEELDEVNSNVFKQLTIPTEIPGASSNNVKVALGTGVIYVIDANKDLWAWGTNLNNRLGLNKTQQVEYTGRTPIKLSFNKNVEDVFPTEEATYVLTKENNTYKLFGSGCNTNGQIGNGKVEEYMSEFSEIPFPNPENIYKIHLESASSNKSTFIFTKNIRDGKEHIDIYYAGDGATTYSFIDDIFASSAYANTVVTNFVRINDGTLGCAEPARMIGYYPLNLYDPKTICVDENGKAYWYNVNSYSEITFDENEGIVNDVCVGTPGVIILKRTLTSGDVQFWAYDRYNGSHFYTSYSPAYGKLFLLNDYFPSNLDANNIVDFGVNNGKAFYLITNDGKLYASGYEKNTGMNSALSSPTSAIIEVTSYLTFKPKEIYYKNYNTKYENDRMNIGIKDEKGNAYFVNEPTIVFRDLILQSSWKKIASNVKYFNAEQSNNCMAYIDKNDDIWVIGDNPLNVGAGNESNPITAFMPLKNFYSESSDTYKHIDGKVSKYKIASTCIYILTNEKDNNTLYCAGDYLSYGWTKYSYIGTGLDEVVKEPTKLLENITDIEANSLERTALKYDKDNNQYTLYYWGCSDGGAIIKRTLVPIEWSESSTFFAGATSAKLYQISYDKNYIYVETNDNCKLVVCGRNSYGTVVNGLGVDSLGKYTPLVYEGQNKIKDFSILGGGTGGIFITVENEIFGFGHKDKLGMATESTERVELPTRLNLPSSDVTPMSIVCSSEGYIITTAEGKVYGTGGNQYGTLGRWIGIDRNSPNSRFKTAFEWVECPELEI